MVEGIPRIGSDGESLESEKKKYLASHVVEYVTTFGKVCLRMD